MTSTSSSHSMEPGARMKQLADHANDFQVNKNAPIIRYYRSGSEMLKMGNVYYAEADYEKAYILFLKYLTLFVEKIRQHPDFKTVSAADKNRTRSHTKDVMAKSEKLKLILRAKFEDEYRDWVRQEEERKAREEEEERQRKVEEGKRAREEIAKYQEAKERTLVAQRDYEAALFHQIQADKEYEQEQLEEAMRRSKQTVDTDEGPIVAPVAVATNTPSAPPAVPDRSSKPQSLGLYSVNEELRRLLVPPTTMSKFLSVAQSNTSKNVETCGILAGKLSNHQFNLTHVLVPKQKGTADSCTMSEDDLGPFEYLDQHDLITLGWIHTHPSQTAFLSSVDLHNHLPYQLMLPEAVAIVCAPKKNETGFFVLTQNHGLKFLTKCTESGFHPHPNEPPLFEEGRHVQLDRSGAQVTLVDFR